MFDLETRLMNAHSKGIEVIISTSTKGFDVIASKNNETYSYCGSNLYLGINSTIAGCDNVT